MGNMREISIEECMRVSGGTDIVVIGTPPPPSSDGEIVVTGSKNLFGNMYGNYTDNPYYKAAMAGDYGAPTGPNLSGYGPGTGPTSIEWIVDGKPMVDTDGDGLPDSPEIAVIAEKVNLPGDYYAYLKNGEFIIMKDGWFTNTYQGTFQPGTTQNHDFVAKDSAIEVYLKTKFGEPGVRVEPGSERYFKSVPEN